MSLREENRENKNCPSRGLGLGLAAAAIGVGVGAALYYFISKRPENPNTSGATQEWVCDPDQTLNHGEESSHDTSYTTISAHSTSYTTISAHSSTDTSINDSIQTNDSDNSSVLSETSSDDSSDISDDSFMSYTETDDTMSDLDTNSDSENNFLDETFEREVFNERFSDDSIMSDTSNYDTTSELAFLRVNILKSWIDLLMSSRASRVSPVSSSPSRKRSWSLEECTICCEVILQDQEVMSLPCTHHFHNKCILPWLQEQQTCPNCRKNI